jgi:hypothetical protein
MLVELKNYINKAKRNLSKQNVHNCENWGQYELRKAKDLFCYEHWQESARLINDFEKWIDEQ